MEAEEFLAKMEEINTRLTKAYHKVDMAKILMNDVIERTEKFREGFFSQKKIDHESRVNMQKLLELQQTASSGLDIMASIEMMNECIAAVEKMYDEIMAEIERLDS